MIRLPLWFKILGHFQLLPLTILVYVFYIIPMLILKGIRFDGWSTLLVPRFIVPIDGPKWHLSLWGSYHGLALPVAIIVRYDHGDKTETHELVHIKQLFTFGILQPILYIGHSIFIWLFQKEKHSYYDNFFEREARREAGQMVDIPKEFWKDPEDRWLWW